MRNLESYVASLRRRGGFDVGAGGVGNSKNKFQGRGMFIYFEETHDIPDIIFEAQIDHSICLVHAEELAALQIEPNGCHVN